MVTDVLSQIDGQKEHRGSDGYVRFTRYNG